MSLRLKTAWIIGGVLLGLLIALYAASSRIVGRQFKAMEEREARLNMERVLNVLEADLQDLVMKSADWAVWNDSYEFIRSRDPNFIRSNLPDPTFIDLRLNAIVFADTEGRIVLAKGFDLQNKGEASVPEGLQDLVGPRSALIRHAGVDSLSSGFAVLPEGPIMVAIRPIVTSQRTGPIRGTLLFARRLDTAELERLSQIARFPLKTTPVGVGALPPGLADSPHDRPTVVLEEGTGVLKASALLRDIFGKPALIATVDLSREVFAQSQSILDRFFVWLAMICLVFIGMALLMLERIVLIPLARLKDEVGSIASGKDPGRRLLSKGHDELNALAVSINGMLEMLEGRKAELEHRNNMLLLQKRATDKLMSELESSEKKAKKAAEDLLESTLIRQTILDTSPMGIIVANRDGKFAHWNPAAEQMIGLGSADHAPSRWSEKYGIFENDGITPFPPGDLPLARAIRGEVVNNVEFFVRNEGKPGGGYMNASARPLRDRNGGLMGGVVVFYDVTDRKRIDRMKNEFISTVSHELRTPLTSIRGSLGLIAGGKAGAIPPAAQTLLNMGIENCERLTRLINDMLDLEKIESGKMEFPVGPVELVGVVEKAIDLNRAYGDQFKVAFSLENPGVPATVNGNPDKLVQVLTNLLCNAAKFSPPGGEVKVSLVREKGRVRVCVADKGPGIPPEFHDRVFHKFAQADASDTRGKGGTGLGLSIVKALVERMGGQVGFTTEAGRGSTFYFDLPGPASSLHPGER